MSVLVADYTLVVRKQSLERKCPGGVQSFVEALEGLKLPPQFVCTADAHLVNASFSSWHAMNRAAIWMGGLFDISEVPTTGAPDLAYVDQIVGPDTECDWLEWRRDSSVSTCAWLTGTQPGEVAAPEGWVPREHCVIEETLAQVDAEAHARAATMGLVRATLDRLECPYDERTPNTVGFLVETDIDSYIFVIVVGDRGSISCTCVPEATKPLRHMGKLGVLLSSANQQAQSRIPRIALRLTEFEGRIGCFTVFVPAELAEAEIEFAIEATLDLADDVQTVLSAGRKSA